MTFYFIAKTPQEITSGPYFYPENNKDEALDDLQEDKNYKLFKVEVTEVK